MELRFWTILQNKIIENNFPLNWLILIGFMNMTKKNPKYLQIIPIRCQKKVFVVKHMVIYRRTH